MLRVSFRETVPGKNRLGESVKSEWAKEVEGSKSIPRMLACCLELHHGCANGS